MQRILIVFLLLFAGVTASTAQPNAWMQDTSLHAGTSYITSLLRPTHGGLLLGVDSAGLFRSDGAGWLPAPWPLGATSPYVLHEVGPDTLLVGTAYNGIYRSTDRGATWKAMAAPAEAVIITHILDHKGTLHASATNGGLRSTDRGTTWRTVFSTDQVLQFEHTPHGTLIAAHVGRRITGGSGRVVGELIRSTDDGANWGSIQYDSLVTTVEAAPDGRLYCGGYGVFGVSSDDGANWAFRPFPDRVVRLGFSPDGFTVYAATRHGLIRTSDQGATWQTELAADSIGAITMLSIPRAGTWYAGDEHGRLFRRAPAASAPSASGHRDVVTATPNPASTHVRFHAGDHAASLGAITVTTLDGRTVLRVGPDDHGSSPRNEILLDVRALPAGIYLFRVVDGVGKTTAGSFVVVR